MTGFDLIKAVKRIRVQCPDEKALQSIVEDQLHQGGGGFEREAHLSPHDRPDFRLSDGVAVELKVKGSVGKVARQLARYAAYADVPWVLLITTSARLHTSMPNELHGKPVRSVLVSGRLG